MVRKISCFHSGARAIVIALGVIWISFRIDSMSSTVRERSSSASSTFSLTSFSSATGQGANETSPSPASSFQRCSPVNGMNGERSRIQTEQSVWSSRLPSQFFREPAAVPLQVGLDPEVGFLECLPGLEVVEGLGGPRRYATGAG